MTKEQMWSKYRKINPLADGCEAWSFGGNSPEMANKLANLVLTKNKTATSSAYPCYPSGKVALPRVGEFNVILNTNEEAVCITKTTKVHITPFCDVSAEHAFQEGEGDRSLAHWRKCHSEFFSIELETIGQGFDTGMLVVCEEFEVVYPLK